MDANTFAAWFLIGALVVLLVMALVVFLLYIGLGFFAAFVRTFLYLEKKYDAFLAWRQKKAELKASSCHPLL